MHVLDKGRSVGGRLATRRIGAATLDHGAQFFTARGDDFAASVREALVADVAYEWCRGFGPAGDGHPRYAARPGMTGLAKHLTTGLDIMVDARVDTVLRLDAKRLVFLTETLVELAEGRPIELYLGDPAIELRDRSLAVTHAPVPGFETRAAALHPAETHPWPWLRAPRQGSVKSFSAWRKQVDRT